MGMTTQCPHCGMTFIIPTIQAQPAPEPVVDVYSQPYVPDPVFVPEPEPEPEAIEEHPGGLLDELEGPGLLESAAAPVLHIPCPNGHELETPPEMLGQEVLCPHCGVQFRLRNEDSVEYQQARDIIDRRRAKLWFNWAIAAAVCIGLGLLVMIVYVVSS